MFDFLKRKRKAKFDSKVLRKNDISLLILDERWNKLFETTQKSPQIAAAEEKLKDRIKEEARLTAEAKEIAASKKNHMDRIIKLHRQYSRKMTRMQSRKWNSAKRK